jgi:hypothetical protein
MLAARRQVDETLASTTYQKQNWFSPMKWYRIWAKVYFWPSFATFEEIISGPNAAPGRAYLWLGVVAGICFIALMALSGSFADSGFRNVFCFNMIAWPFAAFAGMRSWPIFLHRLAGDGEDQRKRDHLIYCSGAIMAPGTLILVFFGIAWLKFWLTQAMVQTAILETVTIPILFFLLWGIHQLLLWVNAVRAVEGISTGKAALIVVLPGAFFLLFISLGVLSWLIPALLMST